MSAKQDLAELLTEVAQFSRSTKRERQTIARNAQAAELPAGTDLVREGEPGDALFLILEGEAVVRREGHDVGRVGPGSHFGELAILDGAPRSATVVAATDVRVAVLGIRMFRTLLREFPELAEQLLIGLAGELRKAQAQVQEAVHPHAT
jgi:CRP-like cAMP-binding protein